MDTDGNGSISTKELQDTARTVGEAQRHMQQMGEGAMPDVRAKPCLHARCRQCA